MRTALPLAIAAAVVLTGCGAAVKRENQSYRLHGPACEQLGYKVTSDEWAACAVKLERARVIRMESIQVETAADQTKTMTCDLTVRPTVCK